MKKVFLFSALLLLVSAGFLAVAQLSLDPVEPTENTEIQAIPVVKTANPVVDLETPGITSVSVLEDRFNFGEVRMGDTARHTFYVLNTGKEPLEFTRAPKPSCGCTLTDYSKEPVEPGKKAFVEVIFPAKKTGIFKKSVTLSMNTEPSQKILSFQGEVIE